MSGGAYSRNKGSAWEVALAGWLRDRGVRAITSRDARGGAQGGPDLITDLPVCVEAKNHASMNLAGWVDQACAEADDAPGSVWIKRRGRADPGEAYVVMRAADFVALVTELASRPLDDAEVRF